MNLKSTTCNNSNENTPMLDYVFNFVCKQMMSYLKNCETHLVHSIVVVASSNNVSTSKTH